jgi:hypothetical protein
MTHKIGTDLQLSDIDQEPAMHEYLSQFMQPVLVRVDTPRGRARQTPEKELFHDLEKQTLGAVRTLDVELRALQMEVPWERQARGESLPCYLMYKGNMCTGILGLGEGPETEKLARLENFILEAKNIAPGRRWREHVHFVNKDNFKREVLRQDMPVLVRVQSGIGACAEPEEKSLFYNLAAHYSDILKTASVTLNKNGENMPDACFVGKKHPCYIMFKQGKMIDAVSVADMDDTAACAALGTFVAERVAGKKPRPVAAPVVTDRTFRKQVRDASQPVLVCIDFLGVSDRALHDGIEKLAAENTHRFKTVRMFTDQGAREAMKYCDAEGMPYFMMFKKGKPVAMLKGDAIEGDILKELPGFIERGLAMPASAGIDLDTKRHERKRAQAYSAGMYSNDRSAERWIIRGGYVLAFAAVAGLMKCDMDAHPSSMTEKEPAVAPAPQKP